MNYYLIKLIVILIIIIIIINNLCIVVIRRIKKTLNTKGFQAVLNLRSTEGYFLRRRQLEVSSRPRRRSQRAPPIMSRICWIRQRRYAGGDYLCAIVIVLPSTVRWDPVLGCPVAASACGVCHASPVDGDKCPLDRDRAFWLYYFCSCKFVANYCLLYKKVMSHGSS